MIIFTSYPMYFDPKRTMVMSKDRICFINPSGTDDVYGRPSDRGHMTCIDASVPVFCARFLSLSRLSLPLHQWLRCPLPPVTARNYLSTPSPDRLGHREAAGLGRSRAKHGSVPEGLRARSTKFVASKAYDAVLDVFEDTKICARFP